MRTFNVLSLTRLSANDRANIEAVDPGVRLTDAGRAAYRGHVAALRQIVSSTMT